MVAEILARNSSGKDDPPLGPDTLAAWHEQNRRPHQLMLARLEELPDVEG